MANVIEVVIRAKDEASSQIAKVEQALGVAQGSFAKFALVGAGVAASFAAAAAGINAYVQAVRQGANVADGLNKIAQQTGMTVEEVSRLKYAADQSNTSLESLAGAIKFMSRNLFEAQRGGAEQVATLKELGFAGREAEGYLGTTSEALLKISDRLKAVEDPGTRVALAMRLLGRSAQESIEFMSLGSDEIRKLGEVSDRTGQTVSTLAGKLGDEFNDKLKDMEGRLNGVKTRLAEVALPAFITAVEAAADAITKMGKVIEDNRAAFEFLAGFIGKSVEFVVKISVIGLEAVQDALNFLKPFMDVAANAERMRNESARSGGVNGGPRQAFRTGNMVGGTVEYRQDFITLPEETVSASRPTKKPKVLTEADKKAIEDAKKAMEAFNAVVANSYLVSEQLGKSLLATLGAEKAAPLIAALQQVEDGAIRADTALRGLKPLDTPQDAIKKLIDNQPGEVEQLQLVQPEQNAQLAAALQYLDDIGASVGNVNEALSTGGETWQTITVGVEAFGASMRDAMDPLRNIIADMSDAAYQFSQSFIESFGGLFENLIEKGQRFRDAFASFMLSIAKAVGQLIKDLLAAIAKALILKAITGAVTGGASTIVPSPFMNRGGSIAMAAGGTFARLAGGGQAPLKLAGGAISILGGNPQAFDRIPALLSPGEAVLPTVGGRSPGPLLSDLTTLGKDLATFLARGSALGDGGGQRVTNNFHLNAIEADGFRGYIRTGAFGREFALAGDPARD